MDPLDALPRIALAHLPTPIVQIPQLSARLGCELFVKRDDVTGGAESGNKLRKLEFLMAEALDQGCDTVLTTGGIQSNHARATALVCARLGLACVLFLRVDDPFAPLPLTGNVLLDALAGATIRPITREQYRTRDELMAAAARAPWSSRARSPTSSPRAARTGSARSGTCARCARCARRSTAASPATRDRST